MANRVLRDWTTSENMDEISPEAEVFFTRLIMKADDYGSYYSNPKLLKAALFPLKEVTYQQIGKWVFECIKADLIFIYEVDEKEYIRIKNFNQRLRNMRNAFPHPPADYTPPVASTRSDSPPDIETKQKQETETKRESEHTRTPTFDAKVSRESIPADKLKIFESLFTDEIYLEGLVCVHPNKDIKKAFEECYIHHSNAPNPPTELGQWKQKLNTWLINTKNGTNKKSDAINARREGFARKHGPSPGG